MLACAIVSPHAPAAAADAAAVPKPAAPTVAAAPTPRGPCRPNPLGTRQLYLRGDFNQWAAEDSRALYWNCSRFEGVVTLEGSTRFKFGDDGWAADADFGAGALDSTLLAPKGPELRREFHGTYRMLLDMADSTTTPNLLVQACPAQAGPTPTLFLRGAMTGWSALDDYAFQYSCDAWYLNVTLTGRTEFKVADIGWLPASTYGAKGGLGDVAANVPFHLSTGDVANLAFDFKGEHTLRLAFPGGMPTLGIGPLTWANPRQERVSDPVALSLRHDSRAASDKSPFGAMPAGTEAGFVLHGGPGVAEAWLVLESRLLTGNQDLLEYREIARLPMTRSGSGDDLAWHASHRFDAKGVYGYWFLVRVGAQWFAYQNNRDVVPWTREKGSNGVGAVDALGAPAGFATAPLALGSVSPATVRRYRLTVYDPAFEVPSWARDAVFYYIFPDRFRNGDPSNDPKPGVTRYHDKTVELHNDWNQLPFKPHSGDGSDDLYSNDFFGGDIAGIIEKLDYIADLGANTLYITPLFRASSNHKYDTADYHQVDPGFGSNADFARLASEAAKRGIRLLPDVSLNHVGADSLYFDRYGNFGGQGAFANGRINPASPYADWFSFDATQSEPDRQYRGWVGVKDLPELDKSSASFRRFAFADPDSVMLLWLDQGAAGWRMDVAPWVPDDFWREWRSAIRAHKPDALLVSEAWFDASKFLLGDMFDASMNYIFRNVVLDYAAGGDAQASYPSLELVREAYPPQSLHAAMNLLSGHDVARTLHVLGWKPDVVDPAAITLAKQRLRLAMFFQLSYPGAPAIFYGDEVGVTGGDDPYNRGTYPWADRGGKPDLALLADVKALLAMRKAHPVLSHGSLDAPLLLDAHRIVLLRRDGAAWAVTATNNAQVATTVRITLPADAPASFRDALTGEMHAVGADHVLEFAVPALFGTALVAD